MKLILIPTFVLAAAQPGADPSKVVGDTTLRWEQTTGIDVSPESENNLRREIPRITNQLGLKRQDPAYNNYVDAVLTRDFLYWSRHRAGKDVKRLGEPTTTPSMFELFIKERQHLLGREMGDIHVTSDPDEAPIEIDGTAKGPTEGLFAASVGSHTVVVRPSGKNACTRTVKVSAGSTEKVDCR